MGDIEGSSNAAQGALQNVNGTAAEAPATEKTSFWARLFSVFSPEPQAEDEPGSDQPAAGSGAHGMHQVLVRVAVELLAD